MGESAAPSGKSRRLSDVVREVKVAAAEREDVVVDMKEADRARLELLAEELAPVFQDVPEDDEQFDFALSSGLQPRLWIDAVAHVHMGRDRRLYRFVRDTRYGRAVIAESNDMIRMADSVTRYVAERMVERQRFLESDRLPQSAETKPRGSALRKEPPREAETAAPPAESTPGRNAAVPAVEPPALPSPAAGLLWFLLGSVFGAALLFVVFRIGLGQ